jgi:hypothetical protein
VLDRLASQLRAHHFFASTSFIGIVNSSASTS